MAFPSPLDEWCHPRKSGSGRDVQPQPLNPQAACHIYTKVCSGSAEVCAQLEALIEGPGTGWPDQIRQLSTWKCLMPYRKVFNLRD